MKIYALRTPDRRGWAILPAYGQEALIASKTEDGAISALAMDPAFTSCTVVQMERRDSPFEILMLDGLLTGADDYITLQLNRFIARQGEAAIS